MPDPRMRDLFPEFRGFFDSWMLSKRDPSFRSLGKRSVLELMRSLNESHLAQIEGYLNESVVLIKTESNIVYHVELEETSPNNFPEQFQEFAITRDSNSVSLTFWR